MGSARGWRRLLVYSTSESALPLDVGSVLTSGGAGLCSQAHGEVNICTVLCLKVWIWLCDSSQCVRLQPVAFGGACRGEKLSKYCDMGSLSVDFNVLCTVFQGSWQLGGGLILCVTQGCHGRGKRRVRSVSFTDLESGHTRSGFYCQLTILREWLA